MFYLKIPYFDIDKTYDCEQSSQWCKLREGRYCIVDGEKHVIVEQGYKGMFGFSCNEEEFFNYWYQFFGVDIDYLQRTCKVRFIGKSYKRISVRAQGIRLMKQQFNTALVQEVFRQNIKDDSTLGIYMNLFSQGAGTKHRNSIRGGGTHIWYDIPDDHHVLLNRFSKIVNVFKKNIPSKNKKSTIRTLKEIKAILLDLDWYDFDEMDFNEFVDTFMIYGLEYKTCQRIWMYGLYHTDVFVIDEEIEEAVKDADDWDEYDNAEEFEFIALSTKELQKSAGLLNQMLRWDKRYPPKPGDETLWETY